MHERQGIFINFKSTLLIACVFENCAVHRPLKGLKLLCMEKCLYLHTNIKGEEFLIPRETFVIHLCKSSLQLLLLPKDVC